MGSRRTKHRRAAAKLAKQSAAPRRANTSCRRSLRFWCSAPAPSQATLLFSSTETGQTCRRCQSDPGQVVRPVKSLDVLLRDAEAQLNDVDIAEMNLLCASGSPAAEKLDISYALATLHQWAERDVRKQNDTCTA